MKFIGSVVLGVACLIALFRVCIEISVYYAAR